MPLSPCDASRSTSRALLDPSWKAALAALALALGMLLLIYHTPVRQAAALWWQNAAYNHALLILPISLYLIYSKRQQILSLTPAPTWWGLAVMAGFALLFLISDAADLAEGQHFALVGMIQGLVLTVLGPHLFRIMLFPLMYLWLMVPTGTFLLPTLQRIATALTVMLLHLTDIPVFSQGTLIEVPTGSYTVAPGCAGLNFLFTAAALAPLYAYLTYTRLSKRLAAVAIMLVTAVLANAVRIFAIIALAEWTERKIDIVDDHLLYGWGFFALVLALMAALGWRFADPVAEPASARVAPLTPAPVSPASGPEWRPARSVIAAGLALVVGVSPVIAMAARSPAPADGTIALSLPAEAGPWHRTERPAAWRPLAPTAHRTWVRTYSDDRDEVDLFIAYYQAQSAHRELIASQNHLADPTTWRRIEQGRLKNPTAKGPARLIRSVFTNGTRKRLVWSWYWVDGRFTSSPLLAKLLEAKTTLAWGDPRAAEIAIAVDLGDEPEKAAAVLTRFLTHGPDLAAVLAQARWRPDPETQGDR